MHAEILPPKAQEVLKSLKDGIRGGHFILAGGTGLALYLGHRMSVDLDLFSEDPFSTENLFQQMKGAGLTTVVLQEEKGSLTVLAEGVKVSFFHYPYPFAGEKAEFLGIPVADLLDIASMKVIAISQRGAKRDFIDLYFILQDIPFRKIAENMTRRYGANRINPVNIGKSLVYFADADADPEPDYRVQPSPDWKAVKKYFVKNVRQMVLDMEGAE